MPEHHNSSVDLSADATVWSFTRLIASCPRQFHPIPEIDAWRGKGLTEWTNVAKTLPKFAGHYQPYIPDDPGFDDLAAGPGIRLAKRYGVYGFCYFHYWLIE
jgi:lipopolysaccharide biosynthesis protein